MCPVTVRRSHPLCPDRRGSRPPPHPSIWANGAAGMQAPATVVSFGGRVRVEARRLLWMAATLAPQTPTRRSWSMARRASSPGEFCVPVMACISRCGRLTVGATERAQKGCAWWCLLGSQVRVRRTAGVQRACRRGSGPGRGCSGGRSAIPTSAAEVDV